MEQKYEPGMIRIITVTALSQAGSVLGTTESYIMTLLSPQDNHVGFSCHPFDR